MPIIDSRLDGYNPTRDNEKNIRKKILIQMSVDDLVCNSSVTELKSLFPEALSYSDSDRHNQMMVQSNLIKKYPWAEKIADALERLKAIEELERSK